MFYDLATIQRSKELAIEEQRLEEVAGLQNRESTLRQELDALRSDSTEDEGSIVGPQEVAEVVSMWTGIPLAQLHSDETERLLGMEEALHHRVVAQDEAISVIARWLCSM